MAKPGRRSKNVNIATPQNLGPLPTREMLKRTLSHEMFNKQPDKWTMPDDVDLENLSTTLHVLRSYVSNSNDMWAAHDQAVQEATERLAQLKTSLFQLLRSFERASAAIEMAPKNSQFRLSSSAKEPHVRAMILAVAHMQNDPVFTPVSDKLAAVGLPIIRHWNECISSVAEECEKVLRTKPGNDPKMSRNGPFARFLAALIPSITGEEPTASTVAEFMMRSKELR